MTNFEIAFYSELPDPTARVFCQNLEAARFYIRTQLLARRSDVYTATVWNTDPKTFICFYMNDRDELFESTDPWILTRDQAAKLRRQPLP